MRASPSGKRARVYREPDEESVARSLQLEPEVQLETSTSSPATVDSTVELSLPGGVSISGEIGGLDFNHATDLRIDTGSRHSMVDRKLWGAAGGSLNIKEYLPADIMDASGTRLEVSGRAWITLYIKGIQYRCSVYIVDGLSMEVVLGVDFLK